MLSGSGGYGLVRTISTQTINSSNVSIVVNKSNLTKLFTVTGHDTTGTLPNYTGLPAGFYFTAKNKSNTFETEIKPSSGQLLDGEPDDALKLQPKSSLTFVNSGDGSYGWIVE